MTEPASAQDLFKGRHFDQEIIVLCIRWYLTFKLSSHDLVQMFSAVRSNFANAIAKLRLNSKVATLPCSWQSDHTVKLYVRNISRGCGSRRMASVTLDYRFRRFRHSKAAKAVTGHLSAFAIRHRSAKRVAPCQ